MSLFQSALDFLAGPGSVGAATRDQNDFVGQMVELGEMKLRIKRVIAEGGFAFVYEAQDISSGKDYALKRLLSNEDEKNKEIIQEVCFMKKLSGHPNVVQFCSAASIGKEESDTGQAEFLILTELCRGLERLHSVHTHASSHAHATQPACRERKPGCDWPIVSGSTSADRWLHVAGTRGRRRRRGGAESSQFWLPFCHGSTAPANRRVKRA